MSSTQVTRRAALSGATAAIAVAAVPIGAMAGAPAPSPTERLLFQLEAQLAEAVPTSEAAAIAVGDPVEAMDAWLVRNPKPEMREAHVGKVKWTGGPIVAGTPEYHRWEALVDEANADLRLAIKEHAAAVNAWAARKHTAEANCRLAQLKGDEAIADGKVGALIRKLADTRADTFVGLASKARSMWFAPFDTGLCFSIVQDLYHFQKVNA